MYIGSSSAVSARGSIGRCYEREREEFIACLLIHHTARSFARLFIVIVYVIALLIGRRFAELEYITRVVYYSSKRNFSSRKVHVLYMYL